MSVKCISRENKWESDGVELRPDRQSIYYIFAKHCATPLCVCVRACVCVCVKISQMLLTWWPVILRYRLSFGISIVFRRYTISWSCSMCPLRELPEVKYMEKFNFLCEYTRTSINNTTYYQSKARLFYTIIISRIYFVARYKIHHGCAFNA